MFGGLVGGGIGNALDQLKKKKTQQQFTPPGIGIGQGGGTTRQGQTPQQWYGNGGAGSGYTGGYGGGVGTGGNAGAGNFSLPANTAPAPPPAETYSMDDPNSRIASVDSTFRDQESMYNEQMTKFIEDIARRRGTLISDTDKAEEGVARNREIGMTGIGEDFAARGLGHSGLFINAAEKGTEAYDRQNNSLLDAETSGLGDLAFTESKEKSDNTARIQAAKRDALYRLQLKNQLVTGM